MGDMDSTITNNYQFPQVCVRCGSPNVTVTGQIIKQQGSRPIRFIWERQKPLSITVPACEACKAELDRHTGRAIVLYWVINIVVFFAILRLGGERMDGFPLFFLAIWSAALSSWLILRLYKQIFTHPLGVTWPDLCTYEEENLTFKQPEFHREFLRLNYERQAGSSLSSIT
jgi:hypothetical protein